MQVVQVPKCTEQPARRAVKGKRTRVLKGSIVDGSKVQRCFQPGSGVYGEVLPLRLLTTLVIGSSYLQMSPVRCWMASVLRMPRQTLHGDPRHSESPKRLRYNSMPQDAVLLTSDGSSGASRGALSSLRDGRVQQPKQSDCTRNSCLAVSNVLKQNRLLDSGIASRLSVVDEAEMGRACKSPRDGMSQTVPFVSTRADLQSLSHRLGHSKLAEALPNHETRKQRTNPQNLNARAPDSSLPMMPQILNLGAHHNTAFLVHGC